MESKLALYQLAAPQLGGCTSCRSAMSVPIKQWNYSFDNIMNRFTQLVGAAGSVNNLINAFTISRNYILHIVDILQSSLNLKGTSP